MPQWNWPCGWKYLPDLELRHVVTKQGRRTSSARLSCGKGQTPGVAGAASPGGCHGKHFAAEGHSAHSGLQLDHCDRTSFPESPPTNFTRPMTVAPGFQGHARHLDLRATCRASRLHPQPDLSKLLTAGSVWLLGSSGTPGTLRRMARPPTLRRIDGTWSRGTWRKHPHGLQARTSPCP